jgi:hypothetical protein
MSQYYHYPLGSLVFDCLPAIQKKGKKLNVLQGDVYSFTDINFLSDDKKKFCKNCDQPLSKIILKSFHVTYSME